MLEGGQPIITVVDALPEHVRELGYNQRQRDIDIANRMGILPHQALWRLYKKSIIRKTVLVNEKVIAIFGVNGAFLGKKANPWFVASPYVDDYPIKLGFRYRSEIKNMLKLFHILEDLVPIEDEKTINLLKILGFKFSGPESYKGIDFVRATLER